MDQTVSGILVCLVASGLIFLAWHFLRKSALKKSVYFILLLGLLMRIVASTDPYLHAWDERYHALVAKNLIEHPLTPTLHEHTVLAYDNTNWVGSNIWLGKPSFPLWIMAGSIATFGNNLFAVRLPSVLLGLLAIWLTFLIGRQLFGGRVGVLAAFFHAINGLIIELVGGRVSSDHVEVCFTVLVELAIYFAVVNLGRKPIWKFSALTGLFMGLAFLSKWYPALIVMPVWFVLFFTRKDVKWSDVIKHGLIVFGSSLVAVLPWVLYMWNVYPEETEAILFNALSAYSATVESHDAPFYYYWHKIMVVFNELIYLPLLYFVYKSLRTRSRMRFHFFGLLTWMLLPLIVFSLADTKRFTYLLISAPAFFIVISWFWFEIKDKFVPQVKGGRKVVGVLILIALIVLPLRYMIERSKIFGGNELVPEFYTLSPEEREVLDENTIVFGTDDYIEMMFHTDVYAAYRQIPSVEKVKSLEAEGFNVVFYNAGRSGDSVWESP